ncbi:MAG TPA: hypothetical protein PLX33_09445 [Alphaproteobacteria bacterium]|nr:hypothetical protein [Alphaproteobacteria bacterium]
MNRYFLSPELQRQIWLRFSWLRVLLIPVALMCIIYSHYMIYNENWALVTSSRLIWVYFILVGIWGNHEAANTMREEVSTNTWDMQRMTPQGTASLVFGKVFGATSYVWYAGILTMLAALVLHHIGVRAFYGPVETSPSTARLVTPYASLYFVFFMIMGGILAHATAFLASLDGMVGKVEADPRHRRPRIVIAFLAGFGISWFLIRRAGARMLENGHIYGSRRTVEWFNFEMPMEMFIGFGALFFTLWVFVGIYRLARAEMMYSLTPLCWFLAVAAISLFAGGIAFDSGMVARNSIFEFARSYAFPFYVFSLSLGATYYAMLAQAGDLRRYGRMAEAFRARRWRKVFENMPQWMASFVIVLAAFFFVLYVVRQPVQGPFGFLVKPEIFISLAASLMLFALRDGLAMHVISALSSGHSQKFERSVYYVLVYFLLPAVHLSIALKGLQINPMRFFAILQGEGTAFHPLMYFGWYYPNPFPGAAIAFLPVVAQMVFIAICYLVLRSRGGDEGAAADADAPQVLFTEKSTKGEDVTWTS